MGYCSKIYLVSKGVKLSSEKKRYASVIGMVNLNKIGGVPPCFDKETDCYFFGEYGPNQEVLLDRYDEPLTECSPEALLEWLKEQEKQDEFFRECPPVEILKSMLEILSKQPPHAEIVALHFGY